MTELERSKESVEEDPRGPQGVESLGCATEQERAYLGRKDSSAKVPHGHLELAVGPLNGNFDGDESVHGDWDCGGHGVEEAADAG